MELEVLKAIFPLVYGAGIKDSEVAKSIYDKVVHYLSD
jgi:hypothetical protein